MTRPRWALDNPCSHPSQSDRWWSCQPPVPSGSGHTASILSVATGTEADRYDKTELRGRGESDAPAAETAAPQVLPQGFGEQADAVADLAFAEAGVAEDEASRPRRLQVARR